MAAETDKQMVPCGYLTGIKFDLMNNGDIEKLSNASIVEMNDLTNPKLGLPNGSSQCATCGSKTVKDCDGHFGVIKLPATIYHPYFIAEIVQILNQICPGCLTVKHDTEMEGFILELNDKSTRRDVYILKAGGKKINGFHKKLLKLCRSKLLVPARSVLVRGTKVRICYLRKCMKVGKKLTRTDNQATCKYCVGSGPNRYPSIRFKISSKDMLGNRSLSIIAEANEKMPKNIQNKNFYEVLPQDFWDFVPNNQQQQEPDKRMNLTPYQAFHMLKQLDPEFIKKFVSKRELLFLSCLPVTPNCHRVVETCHVHADGPQLTFDERTKSYRRVLDISRRIDEFRQHQQFRALASAYVTNRVMDCLKTSKLHSSMSNGESPSGVSGLKWLKEIMLSKRTDNAFRMTMVGDPKIRLDEIGIPPDLAESLFLGEHVNPYNLDKLNMCCNVHLLTKDEIYTRSKGQLMYVQKANQFQVGDIVYRPLVDGDVVLINRPPSVHMHSLIALSVKVLPIQSVIAINPLCCAPLCGDFDGDCLHGYVPQSVHCRVELGELVNLDKQLLNAQDGRSLVSLTHDSLTAAHLLTATQDFLNKFEMQQLAMLFPSQLHMPSIVKSPKLQTPLWSSRQLFSMLLPPGMDYGIGSRNVQISNGEILFSSEMSFWLQNNISSIFSIMFKHYGRKALDLLFSAQDSLCEYLTLRGLSVSLNDVYMSSDYYSRNKMAEEVYLGLEEAENACRIKQLLLDPKIESLLKNFDESEDPSCNIGHYCLWANSPHISQVSVAAFKDVFNDLQKIVRHYASKDNSLLAMLHAGSKGSLLKLVQQSICLGLQLSASKLPFRIPRKLSCNWWNYLKDLECRIPQDGNECAGGQSSFPVIKASFLEGLNPLESFLHAISGRANLFSENAEIPGTLTRKLMFHMRDLYAAYDGTVRNAYGQQIVQFSYEVSDASSHEDLQSCYIYDGKVARNSAVGAPVGSLAACSISEAAYGGLDHPMNSLETSPLMNLKEVLECGKGRTSVNQAGILYLSKRLQGNRYGLEYGALEVKNHLERVLFSDLVNTVMIFYGGYDVEAVEISPWITHFHVSKGRMMRRGLKIQSVIEELLRNYNNLRKNSEALPVLYITNKVCPSIQEWKEHDQTFCISVAVDSSKLMTQLDTIKDAVIPVLLKILIRGFLPFKQVKIQCQSDSVGELYLKVMSENCVHGKFWSSLQNACIPLMDLIDWERSHPEGAYDICSTYGIDAAWKYFLRSLKSSTSNIGRNICREHLLTVTDCLSVTGDFHGLNFRGLKQQRNQLQVSSPFSQACFSSPGSCFVNASKQGSVDNLRGTLDAVAWGKEAPVGTAGSFEIIYSGKDPQSEGVKSVYSFLHNLAVEEPNQDNNVACRSTNQSSSSKCKSMPSNASAKGETNVHLISDDHVVGKNSTRNPVKKLARQSVNVRMRTRHSTFGLQPKYFAAKVGSWANIVDMSTTLRKILHEYPFDGYISETDKSSIIEALAYHPKRDEKVGTGVQQIKIGHSPSHPGTRCFILIRNDGTTVDFSYRKCVIGAAEQISPVLRQLVEEKIKCQR